MKKRKCLHRCMAINNSNKGQCKRLAWLDDNRHNLITFKKVKANLCKLHWSAVFNSLFGKGGVETFTGICTYYESAQ